MASNAQKTPFVSSMNRFAEKKAFDAIQNLGKNLPCHVVAVSGSIVTVAFDLANEPFTLPNVTMPMFGPEYIRYPTQIGDLGVTVTADAYIGGISALGGGTADLTLQSNLSSLIFLPIASANWSVSENPNALVQYGPDGVIIRDTAGNARVTVNAAGDVTVHGAANVVVHALRSLSTDVNGYGTRTTYLGGNDFQIDTYTDGADVNTVPHDWSPPKLPDPE